MIGIIGMIILALLIVGFPLAVMSHVEIVRIAGALILLMAGFLAGVMFYAAGVIRIGG
jgi:hypothetical protein